MILVQLERGTILNQFDFSSDHRPGRASLYLISKAKKFTERIKVEKKISVVLLVHRWGEANGILKEKLEEKERRPPRSVQERYDCFQKAIREG